MDSCSSFSSCFLSLFFNHSYEKNNDNLQMAISRQLGPKPFGFKKSPLCDLSAGSNRAGVKTNCKIVSGVGNLKTSYLSVPFIWKITNVAHVLST